MDCLKKYTTHTTELFDVEKNMLVLTEEDVIKAGVRIKKPKIINIQKRGKKFPSRNFGI
ncbi:MAG: hypothetical protein U5K00_08005 [Melioribacteraceae bacterium]|nr:hypothetical protein [Melioribacteraceae bacterium]